MAYVKKLQLQYGVNVHADAVYQEYKPLTSTAFYPDPHATELREALSKYTGVAADMLFCSSGSDEVVDLYVRIHKLHDPEVTVAFSPPMYFQYPVYAERINAKTLVLPHDRSTITPELLHDLGATPEHTVLMIDNPSNPAGDFMTREQIVAILDAGYRLFLDEAYYEFCHITYTDLLPMYPDQLVISRTLSKIGAIAGSRVGYLMAAPKLLEDFYLHKLHFNVNIEGQNRALFALSHMPELEKAIQSIKSCKAEVTDAIKKLGSYEIFPSLDLFFIFKHKTMPVEDLHEQLSSSYGLETYLYRNFKGQDVIRSAIGQPEAMQQLTAAAADLA